MQSVWGGSLHVAEPLHDYDWMECEIGTVVRVKVLTEEQIGKSQLPVGEQ